MSCGLQRGKEAEGGRAEERTDVESESEDDRKDEDDDENDGAS